MFFLYALIFQALYNISMPPFVSSVNPNFDKKNYQKVKYLDCCAIMLMFLLFLTPTVIVIRSN